MKLVAITAVKYGPKGETAESGQPFEVDSETAKTLIELGSAAAPEDYERAKAAAKPAGERLAELETENVALREENAKLKAELEAKGKK